VVLVAIPGEGEDEEVVPKEQKSRKKNKKGKRKAAIPPTSDSESN